MEGLVGDRVEIIDVIGTISQRRPGTKVFFSHVGFDKERRRACTQIWFLWHTKNGMFYDLKALVFLDRIEDKWLFRDYKPVEVRRGFDEYVGP